MEQYRKYTLQSKDTPLLDFTLYGYTVSIHPGMDVVDYQVKIDTVYTENRSLFPKNMPYPPSDEVVLRWIQKRKVPKNRHFVNSILRSIADDENPLKYADITFALSVNDAYWIVPKDQPAQWKECNLYDHPFDERLAQVAFTGHSQKISGLITTPETTASGALKKCWRRREDGIYLIKGDPFPRGDGRSEAVMEYYASQVADVMGFEHIPYQLEWFTHATGEKEVICMCKLFTSAEEGYVDAAQFFLHKGMDVLHLDLSNSINQVKLASLYGKEKYADMMVFDSLICNQDRHLGNFGYMVNNDTGEFLRPAPIFDNGRSLLYGAAVSDIQHVDTYMEESGLFGTMMQFDKAGMLFIERRHLAGLRALSAYSFRRHPQCQVIAPSTMHILDTFIQSRAKRLLSLYHEKERSVKRATKRNVHTKQGKGLSR